MKLGVFIIFCYLAVSIEAAGGIHFVQTSNSNAAESVKAKQVTEEPGLVELPLETTSEPSTPLPDVNETNNDNVFTPATKRRLHKKNRPKSLHGQNTGWDGQTSILDSIPFPMNAILRTFGKDALKAMDIETMCDAVQLIDWKDYQKMLEAEDFYGFKEKIIKDEILTATAEAVQETTANYINKLITTLTKSIKVDGLDSLQSNLKQFLEVISLNIGGTPKDNHSNVKMNFKKFVENMDTKMQEEALENLQKNIATLLHLLSVGKSNNSIGVSKQGDISGQSKGP